MYLSRKSSVHGRVIQIFFADNPHVLDVIALNLEGMSDSLTDERRIQRRSKVRHMLKDIFNKDRYDDQIAARQVAVHPAFLKNT